ncbi:hypothetical protein F4809DRAFT_366457 [Biscogniauxia mediterranea]|nr:hypothetical protein F4809DRAFT_366457 [Biscogniauxia mediterranea]
MVLNPWDYGHALVNIVKGIGLKAPSPSYSALVDVVTSQEFESAMDADTVSFIANYPWLHAFQAGPSSIVDEALWEHTTGRGQLGRLDQLAESYVLVDGEPQAIPWKPRKPEDYLVIFTHKLLAVAAKQEAETGAETMAWFPRKNPRHLLALSLALMLWLYLDQLTPKAVERERLRVPWARALTYIRITWNCPECAAGYERWRAMGLKICWRCPNDYEPTEEDFELEW